MQKLFISPVQTSVKMKILNWMLALFVIMQSVGVVPLVAYADVTVAVTDSTGATTNYTVATSTDNIAIAYTLPEGYPTSTTPTLDTIADIFSIINDALVSAKASASCTGNGSATANASASATVSLNGTDVVASATASASVNCTPAHEPNVGGGNDHPRKVKICHIPEGNPENMQTIEVDENSVSHNAHLAHGDTGGECPSVPPPHHPVCSLNIVSDATNYIGVVGGSVYATSTYNQNPSWTAMIPGATWIWKTFFVEHPTQDEFVTFTKSFTLPSTALGGMLTVAADNSYTVTLNGNAVGADSTEFNYFETGKDVYNVFPQLQNGVNTLSFTVKNWGLNVSTPQSNPAGLLYKLHIGLTGDGCDVPPPPPVANTKPVITVTGANPILVSVGSPYADLGATATDQEDGNITSSIVSLSTVNTAIVGAYVVTYNVTDSNGLGAIEKVRTVNVVTQCSDGVDNDNDGSTDLADDGCDNPTDNNENSRPVITVATPNPLTLTVGAIFTDAPTAFDLEDATITPNIVTTGTVNTAVVGTYTLTYNVSDSQGLPAITKTRVINVEPVICTEHCGDDNQPPVITVVGANPLSIAIGGIFADPSATVADPEDGNITSKLVVGGMVNTAMVGNYTITYNATDTQNLSAVEKTRLVKVTSSCSDGKDNDGDGLIDFPLDAGCDDANDDSENSKPIITLLGSVIMNIVIGNSYSEPSATVLDAEDGDITGMLITTGTVNTNLLGTYTISYNATDTQNLSADTKTRTVNIVNGGGGGGGGGETPPACSDGSDNDGDLLADYPRDPGCMSSQDNDERDTGPTLTLLGANPMTLTLGATFTDPGATAQDPEEGDITARIVTTGTVNSGTVGTYTLTYNVSDTQGHSATPATRTVNVVSGGGGGGGPITLNITNEVLTVTGTSTVLVTWNTNQPASSQVVYGLLSIPTLGSAPLYGYSLSTTIDTALTTTHSMTIVGIPSGVATFFRPVSADGVRTATGIELTRVPASVLPEACFYLREYMRIGGNNNPEEVTKLQTFLRDFEGFTTLQVTGIFDITTDAAVRSFQDKYGSEVLTPWSLAGNTGYVYYTTQKKINEIYCQRTFPLNDTQLAEIQVFRDLIARINAQVTATPELPLVGVNTLGGSVAGVSTERESGDTENVGRLAVGDLLAVAPNAADDLNGSVRDEIGDNVKLDINGDVAGTSTTRNLAAVVGSVSDSLNITNGTLYFLILFVILVLIFSTIYIRSRNAELVEEEIE